MNRSVEFSNNAGRGSGAPHVGKHTRLLPQADAGTGELGLYLPLDHVGERRSPKMREFEIRQVGSRRESVLIIGAMALSCRRICSIRCTQRWVRAPRSGPWVIAESGRHPHK
jgi:hypothetical protein